MPFVTIASATLIHVSIAASQTLLGVAIVLLVFQRRRLVFPRVWIPLAALFIWTFAADLVCPDPWLGRAQIKKFFVFLFLPLIYAVFSTHFQRVRELLIAWMAAATASGAWGLVQFALKRQEIKRSGADFYDTYLGHRITGFESHWMTFSALQLSVLSLVIAHWFLARRKLPLWAYAGSAAVLSSAIVLAWTRSVWIATFAALLYLVWSWRPKMILLVPVAAALVFAVAPPSTRDRLTSLVNPHSDDSNRHRSVTFWTGVAMVKAHPLFGIGPEEIGRQFNAYVPADVQRPLPVGYYGHLHNIYVQYAAERGIPGLLFVLWFIGLTMWDILMALRRVEKRSLHAAVLHGAMAVIIGVLVGGLAEYNLGDSEVLMMFVCVVGLAYAAIRTTADCERDLPAEVSAGAD